MQRREFITLLSRSSHRQGSFRSDFFGVSPPRTVCLNVPRPFARAFAILAIGRGGILSSSTAGRTATTINFLPC